MKKKILIPCALDLERLDTSYAICLVSLLLSVYSFIKNQVNLFRLFISLYIVKGWGVRAYITILNN